MKTYLVTGNSKGVGFVIAKDLLQDSSVRVLGVSRTITSELQKLMDQYPERMVQVKFDFKNSDGVKDLYINQLKQYGPFYGLVNNAAIAYDDIVSNLNLGQLEDMYRVNVYSPMMLTKYLIRDMLLHGVKGSIVNISSISAHTGYKGLSMYASTKGAIEAFSKNVAREWGSKGIRSNCVCPGFMDTDMSSTLSNEQKQRIFLRNSMKKEVEIASVASTVNFLLSEKSNSVTGQVYFVDCGTI